VAGFVQEKFYIEQLGTFGDGYNMTPGGESPGPEVSRESALGIWARPDFAPMRKAFHNIRLAIKGWERARTARRIRMVAAAEALMADMPLD
jgi:hypothetical protein